MYLNCRKAARILSVTSALAASACGQGEGNHAAPSEPEGEPPALSAAPRKKEPAKSVPNVVPARIDTHPACVLSADCPAGQYCDLGECIQSCNADAPCTAGLECSPRARCIDPGSKDADPDPGTTKLGSLQATSSTPFLTERDDRLTIKLTTDSKEPVRYRVELSAPHLSIRDARGTFVKETTLQLPVDTSHLVGTEADGTVRIITTLGTVVVSAPVRVGVSGTYQGTMTYDGGVLPLGTVGVALALSEHNGEVTAEVDANDSVLFPSDGQGPATGPGVFRYSDGVRFSLASVVDGKFGAKRNHFRRPILRKVNFEVKPDSRGNLSGTFTESIEGLMSRVVTLQGRVSLERRALLQAAAFVARTEPAAKIIRAPKMLALSNVFPGWDESTCSEDDPSTLYPSTCNPQGDGTVANECTKDLEFRSYLGSVANSALGTRAEGAEPLDAIEKDCAAEIAVTQADAPGTVKCALIPRLACALYGVATPPARSAGLAHQFTSLFGRVLEPALMVSQSQIVGGVRSSFVSGQNAEVAAFHDAMAVLDGPATWVLQPKLLDYLADVPPEATDGRGTRTDTLRKLSRLFFVTSTIDGELARLSAVRMDPKDAARKQAQERGVLTLLEAASVMGILDQWGQSAPADVGTEFTDVLTPMDLGFRSLVEGALVFGVPEGYVPFLQTPGDQRSNFEQVLVTIQPDLDSFERDETAFTASNRAYEQNDEELGKELLAIETGIETGIQQICGNAFEIAKVTKEEDWSNCGAGDGGGEVGALNLSITEAQDRLQSSQQRILSMNQKIKIEQARISDVKEVRDGTVAFIKSTGEQLAMADVAEGVLNAAVKAIEVASNANVFNAGAPLAEAAVAAALEVEHAQITAQKQLLQTAQEARVQGDSALVELLNGMAAIKNMVVDEAQLTVEMQTDVLGVLQAEVNVRNAVNRAKRLAVDRQKTLAHIAKSPYRDPSFRILQDGASLKAIRSRATAQSSLFRATRALEYELVGSSRVDLQACKLEYSIVSPK